MKQILFAIGFLALTYSSVFSAQDFKNQQIIRCEFNTDQRNFDFLVVGKLTHLPSQKRWAIRFFRIKIYVRGTLPGNEDLPRSGTVSNLMYELRYMEDGQEKKFEDIIFSEPKIIPLDLDTPFDVSVPEDIMQKAMQIERGNFLGAVRGTTNISSAKHVGEVCHIVPEANIRK